MANNNTHMTRKQWRILNAAIATAVAMAETRIDEKKRNNWDASMYEGWLEGAKLAQKTLADLAIQIPHEIWFAAEEAA